MAHFFEEVNGLINEGSISIDGEDIQLDLFLGEDM